MGMLRPQHPLAGLKRPLKQRLHACGIGRLDGCTVIGNAGNCSAATAREIYGLGGDYILQIKGNQPTLLKYCENAFKDAPRPAPITGKGHGRITERTLLRAADHHEPLQPLKEKKHDPKPTHHGNQE